MLQSVRVKSLAVQDWTTLLVCHLIVNLVIMSSQALQLHPDRPTSAFLALSISTGVLLLIGMLCVGLRFATRMRKSDLWWDDWTILASLIFSIGVFITIVMATAPSLGASGYHITQYTPEELNRWFKVCIQ